MLIKCPECGNPISSKAVSCPHCGYPLAAEMTVGSGTCEVWIYALNGRSAKVAVIVN